MNILTLLLLDFFYYRFHIVNNILRVNSMLYKNILKMSLVGILLSFYSSASISEEDLEKEFKNLVQKYDKQPTEGATSEDRALTEMYTTACALRDLDQEAYRKAYVKYVQFVAKKGNGDFQELLRGLYY